MRYIPGVGPSSAKIVLVGEAPGYYEDMYGYPFAGKTGEIVDRCLEQAGTKRDYVYLTNVVKIKPPGNNLKLLHTLGKRIEDFIPQLWQEIDAIRPNCIIALGNTALHALCGYREGIEHYRGSILESIRGNYKVIPSIHPASILHKKDEHDGKAKSWKDLTYIQWDFNRAVQQSAFPDIRPTHRNLLAARNSLDVYRFLDRFSGKDEVSVDIETFRTIPICIGLAFNSVDAISIPFFNQISALNELGMTRSDIIQCWKDVADLLANPRIKKIGQNFKFDELQLLSCVNRTTHFGMKVRNFWFDTMLAFKTLYCELPGKLEFITSVLTEEPYYKEEGKGYNPKKDKLSRLLLYCAKDAVVTFEAKEKELEELQERKLDDFFFTKVMPLHPLYSRIEGRGILRDPLRHKYLDEKYKMEESERQAELDDLTMTHYNVKSVNVMSNGLNGQVGKLLYAIMGIPLRKGVDEKTLDAILRNERSIQKNEPAKRIIRLILDLRKVRKTRGTYVNAKPHPDGRLRTGCRIMLETGRTATSILKAPVTTEKMGVAFQTITKHGEFGSDLRSMYIADPGYVLIEPDLSQAEARVVAVLARDEKLLKMFEYGVDIHCVTYNWLEKLVDDLLLQQFFDEQFPIECRRLAKELNRLYKSVIPDEKRQMGKKFRHAGHYDMGPVEASRQTGLAQAVTKRVLEVFHRTNNKIRGVFHREIQDALEHDQRKLRNPFGRERQFLNRWGDELFKEAYAQIPQSTVSDQVKFAMLRIERRAPWLQILEESHDSFLSQAPVEYAERTYPIIREELEVPIDFRKCSLSRDYDLIIPCEIKIGENWEEMRKVA